MIIRFCTLKSLQSSKVGTLPWGTASLERPSVPSKGLPSVPASHPSNNRHRYSFSIAALLYAGLHQINIDIPAAGLGADIIMPTIEANTRRQVRHGQLWTRSCTGMPTACLVVFP